MAEFQESPVTWRKSSRSAQGNCVEVAFTDEGEVWIRDSKDRGGGMLRVTADTWREFLRGVKTGEFDLMG